MDFGSGREFTLEGEEAVSSMPEEEYRSLLNEYMIAPDMTELLCAGYASKDGREIDRFNMAKDNVAYHSVGGDYSAKKYKVY